eukprot:1186483-Pyramimonas_sp.AAC.1
MGPRGPVRVPMRAANRVSWSMAPMWAPSGTPSEALIGHGLGIFATLALACAALRCVALRCYGLRCVATHRMHQSPIRPLR